MARRYESRILPANRGQAVAATTEVTFAGPTSAVHVNTSGTLVGTLAGQSTPVSLEVVASTYYPYSFISISDTSAVALVALFN